MYRLGVPIIGITDGDLDKGSSAYTYPPGSIIIGLKEGSDDLIWKRTIEEIFDGADSVALSDEEDLKKRVFEIVGGTVEDVRTY